MPFDSNALRVGYSELEKTQDNYRVKLLCRNVWVVKQHLVTSEWPLNERLSPVITNSAESPDLSGTRHCLEAGREAGSAKWKARSVMSSSGSRPESRPDHRDNLSRSASTNCPADKF
jgi:hypothetical protein